MASVVGITAIALLAQHVQAVNNGLARTPQMGWDNWNSFGCDVSEDLLQGTARLIVDYGLKDLGYEYVVLDDCWSNGRDASANNSLIVDTEKFPRGMAAVADDIHELGLKFGMYSSAGVYTCGRFAGSLGYEEVDANSWAEWGVDYLKYDNCYNSGEAGTQKLSHDRYNTMAKALNATGRPILYSLCNWGEDYPWNWGPTIANSWRITGDVTDFYDRPDPRCPCDGPDAWDCSLPGFHCSLLNIINKASFVVSKAEPGGWNDLDMLEVGNGGMSDAEYKTQFSVWAAVKSPLIMGNDLRIVKPQDLAILSNAAVIAVNQDPLGSSAARRWYYETDDVDQYGKGSIQMWAGSLNSTTGGEYSDMVVLLINGNNSNMTMNATLVEVFADSGGAISDQAKIAWEVRDLWANRMSNEEAQAIIDASSASGNYTSGFNATRVGGENRYNATAKSYSEGLSDADELLLGNVTTTVQPMGTITAEVERHGIAMFRLRAVPTGSLRKRTEL
ncbi:glycoside hydrolase family 27 protein [Pseudomassariella vexata]|uniref:Alpha-galactosidase n=1 Tax=Pseudomassariella vexata TaxID=1141098 RepID=A0A1Y2D7V5_9PEZI|nr:glycoside hydrolase family 27 protein [Pseudomassariella vexata]ORY55287.1 glycoside hydrolase family 27 protein [Pseudomassariella vexata]